MLQDGKAPKLPAPTDFEGLVAQLAALRDDMTRLAGSVTTLAERRGRRMASDISEGASEAMHYVERKGMSAEADLERSVATHPWKALGLTRWSLGWRFWHSRLACCLWPGPLAET